jgi:hypothetical protein
MLFFWERKTTHLSTIDEQVQFDLRQAQHESRQSSVYIVFTFLCCAEACIRFRLCSGERGSEKRAAFVTFAYTRFKKDPLIVVYNNPHKFVDGGNIS